MHASGSQTHKQAAISSKPGPSGTHLKVNRHGCPPLQAAPLHSRDALQAGLGHRCSRGTPQAPHCGLFQAGGLQRQGAAEGVLRAWQAVVRPSVAAG